MGERAPCHLATERGRRACGAAAAPGAESVRRAGGMDAARLPDCRRLHHRNRGAAVLEHHDAERPLLRRNLLRARGARIPQASRSLRMDASAARKADRRDGCLALRSAAWKVRRPIRRAHGERDRRTAPLLYAFAKRLFSSTAAAVTAVVLLLSSGYFYVQARIATPEISVAFFALLTLYCFYRYWTASQIAPVTDKVEYPRLQTALAAFGIILALVILVYAQVGVYNAQRWNATYVPYVLAVIVFATAVAMWSARWHQAKKDAKALVYPDGTIVDGQNVTYPSGETRPLKGATVTDGPTAVTWRADGVESVEGQNRVVWRADGTIEGTIDGVAVKERQSWGIWLALSSIALACFISSKWDGLFALAALWFIATLTYGQHFLAAIWRERKQAEGAAPRRFAWGSPIGIRLPLFIGASILSILVIYVLTYVP